MAAADLPLLAEWLREPQVAQWWNHEHTAEAVERGHYVIEDEPDALTDAIRMFLHEV